MKLQELEEAWLLETYNTRLKEMHEKFRDYANAGLVPMTGAIIALSNADVISEDRAEALVDYVAEASRSYMHSIVSVLKDQDVSTLDIARGTLALRRSREGDDA